MSTIHQSNLRSGPQYDGLRLSADEYFDLPEDPDRRYELVNGLVVMSPSPSIRHQEVAGEMLFQIYEFLQHHAMGSVVFGVDVDLGLSVEGGDIVYRPDLIFIRSEKLVNMGDHVRGVVPDLVVEIVSPFYRRYDLETKKSDYERAGVLEYWVIDPEQHDLHFWRLSSGRYEPVAATGVTLVSQAVPGFTLDVVRVQALFV